MAFRNKISYHLYTYILWHAIMSQDRLHTCLYTCRICQFNDLETMVSNRGWQCARNAFFIFSYPASTSNCGSCLLKLIRKVFIKCYSGMRIHPNTPPTPIPVNLVSLSFFQNFARNNLVTSNPVSLWQRANTRNVRLYYPYWQYTNLFIFRFVSEHCLRSKR